MRMIIFTLFFISLASRAAITELKFIGEVNWQTETFFNQMKIGGLSDAHFDPTTKILTAVSDDDGRGLPELTLFQFKIDFIPPRAFKIIPYAVITENYEPRDAEALARYRGSWIIANERPPELYFFKNKQRITPPPTTPFSFNKAFESMIIDPQRNELIAAGENATDHHYVLSYDLKETPAQLKGYYTYQLDSAKDAALPLQINSETDYGLTSMLFTGHRDQVITLERGYIPKVDKNFAKIYLAALPEKVCTLEEIQKKETKCFIAKKKLLFDLNQLNGKLLGAKAGIDNVEALAFGPRLSNGQKTLIVISDNNFNPAQSTQFLFFEIVD
jgi:hypothetical protein